MEFTKAYLYENFVEMTQELLVALDRVGTIVYINQRGCEILDEQEESILGKNWFDSFFDKSLNDEIKGVYLELVNGNMEFIQYFENTIMTSHNKSLLMSWNNKVLYNKDGEITYVLSSGRDITLERECESELSQTKIALESVMDELKEKVSITVR